jgi:ABC1 atypical kinase-like domain
VQLRQLILFTCVMRVTRLRTLLWCQVYHARLKATGEDVAVKVQRPQVLFTVTRDLYVMRIILNLLGKCGRWVRATRTPGQSCTLNLRTSVSFHKP